MRLNENQQFVVALPLQSIGKHSKNCQGCVNNNPLCAVCFVFELKPLWKQLVDWWGCDDGYQTEANTMLHASSISKYH